MLLMQLNFPVGANVSPNVPGSCLLPLTLPRAAYFSTLPSLSYFVLKENTPSMTFLSGGDAEIKKASHAAYHLSASGLLAMS